MSHYDRIKKIEMLSKAIRVMVYTQHSAFNHANTIYWFTIVIELLATSDDDFLERYADKINETIVRAENFVIGNI